MFNPIGDKMIMKFNTNFLYCFVLMIIPVSRCTNTSTVCYGVSGQLCTTHRLSCPSPLVIQIINTLYGYRPGCNDIIGMAGCYNTTCCNEEPVDCFISFSSEDYQQVAGNCSGVKTCTIGGSRRYNTTDTICNGSLVSAYSKIQYNCVSKGITTIKPIEKSPTAVTQTLEEKTSKIPISTDLILSTYSTTQCSQCPLPQSDNSGVIGGVLGTLLIISVIINIGLVVYITRKIQCLSSTPVENNYDGITNAGRDQTLPTYDALQIQSTGSSDHDDKKKSDNIHTYYNTKTDTLSQNNDQYYVNMKMTSL